MKNQIHPQLSRKLSTLKASHAFSLVELLVVIAVIGIIAAIAIPNIAGITGSATAAKTQRNAQSVASAIASARAAGSVAAPAADTVTGLVDLVSTSPGLTGVGTLSTSTFYVPLSTAEHDAVVADTHLSVSGTGASSTLVYTP